MKPHLGEVFRRLAMQKESRIEEGHLMSDHVHMMIAIPPTAAPRNRGSTLVANLQRESCNCFFNN